MLSASSGFKSALNRANRKFHVKLLITRNDANATPVNLSDRLMSYSYNHDFEARNGRLNLELDNYDYMLSPLNRDSTMNQKAGIYDPILDSNHKVELFEGLEVNGSIEYVKKFEGYLGDELGASSNPIIQTSCRDKSKLLQDVYIYEGPSYALFLVEEVIQDLINEFMPDSGIVVETSNPTQYMIGRPDGPYAPKDINLWDACQMLADSASHELRFMEDGTLLMRKIDRDFLEKPVNLQLDMSTLIDDSMQISDADVRNHIVIKVQGFDPITKIDEESIEKYGRKYMEVHRSMSDIITDVSQAHELGDGILRDLRFANPMESSEIPLHPLVQVGDIVEITNPRLGTNPETDIFQVVGVNNVYSADRKRTYLTLKGHDKFLSQPSIAPMPPTNLGHEMQTRTIQNYPRSGWAGYEKETSFPMITWTPPVKDVENNTLEDNFGGYIIERATKLTRYKQFTPNNFKWTTIASVPSYIGALDLKIDYFYDYSSVWVLDTYRKLGQVSGGKVTIKYRVTAINKRGTKSSPSTELEIEIPIPRTKDANGNYI